MCDTSAGSFIDPLLHCTCGSAPHNGDAQINRLGDASVDKGPQSGTAEPVSLQLPNISLHKPSTQVGVCVRKRGGRFVSLHLHKDAVSTDCHCRL